MLGIHETMSASLCLLAHVCVCVCVCIYIYIYPCVWMTLLKFIIAFVQRSENATASKCALLNVTESQRANLIATSAL